MFVFLITSLFELLSSTLGEQKISFIVPKYLNLSFSASGSAEIKNNLGFKDGTSRNFVLSFRLSRDYRQVYSFILFVVNYH